MMPRSAVLEPRTIEEVRLLTVREVAKRLRVHRKTLWRYSKDRGPVVLKPIKLQNGSVRYHEGEVIAWLRRNRV